MLTECTEWQRPLSGVHSIMTEKFAQAGEGGGCTPATPFHYIYHHEQSFGVCSNWESRYTLPLFLLYPYMYSVVMLINANKKISWFCWPSIKACCVTGYRSSSTSSLFPGFRIYAMKISKGVLSTFLLLELVPSPVHQPREYWMIYRGSDFLSRMTWPLYRPLLPSASWLSFSVFLCVFSRAYWRERGEEPNHTARKPGPL